MRFWRRMAWTVGIVLLGLAGSGRAETKTPQVFAARIGNLLTGEFDRVRARMEKLEDLKDGDIVRIDWRFPVGPAEIVASPCWSGHWGFIHYQPSEVLRLDQPALGKNLVVTIWPGAMEDFPANAVTCEFDAHQPDLPVFRLRGFFVVMLAHIPASLQIELRPFYPPAKKLND